MRVGCPIKPDFVLRGHIDALHRMKLHARPRSRDEQDGQDRRSDYPSPGAFDFGHLQLGAGGWPGLSLHLRRLGQLPTLFMFNTFVSSIRALTLAL